MLVHRTWALRSGRRGGDRRHLRLDYVWGDYTEAEREQQYRVDAGCAGLALGQNQQVFFDAYKAQEPRLGLTATQRQVTEHVNSILSTPIYRPNDAENQSPIAILNLDSRDLISESGFGERRLQELLVDYAALMGATLQ